MRSRRVAGRVSDSLPARSHPTPAGAPPDFAFRMPCTRVKGASSIEFDIVALNSFKILVYCTNFCESIRKLESQPEKEPARLLPVREAHTCAMHWPDKAPSYASEGAV